MSLPPFSHARVLGTGSYLPGHPVSNDALAERGVDTSDEWIRSRTGIASRHIAAPDESACDLAYIATKRALEASGVDSKTIDLIIVATSTPDYIFPSTACLLQERLDNQRAAAFDVQAVCSGFVYALATAEKFIRSGSHRRALVVGAEVFSRILDWQDRSTCVLFGDGAGAVVLEAADSPGILASVLKADGAYNHILNVPGQLCHGQVTGDPFLRMDGQAVYKLAVRVLTEVAGECCEAAGLHLGDIDWLIPHQANARIIEATARKLGLPRERCLFSVERHANTSAASIPLALDEAVRDGRITRRDKVLLEGVGGGFAWGAVALAY